MRQNRILVVLFTMLLMMMFFIPSYQSPNTNPPLENRDDCVVLINESFENGFPPENWTNTGWIDSLYGESYHGDHWAYAWACGDILTTFPIEFGVNTTLTFWYRAEVATHPMNLEVYVNDTLVWEEDYITNDDYEMATVHLDSFSGLKTITFDHCSGDFYGVLLDMITVTTSPIVYVDDDFNSSTPGWQYTHFDVIQDGIDAVADNGTVYVYNGTYTNNVLINEKPIYLIGGNSTSTIIDRYGNEFGIEVIESNGTYISGFTIKNTGHSGIELVSSNNCSILNNIIYNCAVDGIFLLEANYNKISNNEITNNGADGIYAFAASYCNFSGNTIGNNYYDGLYLDVGTKNILYDNDIFNNSDGLNLYYNSYSNVSENNIYNNYDNGIYFSHSSVGRIFDNLIINNSKNGIYLEFGNFNTIYNNYFDNENNSKDTGTNTVWNISKTIGTNIVGGPYLGGNYWSDYDGVDYDGDGLGDTNLPYGPGDYLPLSTITVDINQSIQDRGFPIRHALDGDWAAAQNFTPILDTLTRVDAYLRKFGTPEFNLTVELRENHPQGDLIDTLTFTPEEVPTSWEWLQLNFEDKTVEPDVNLFIVIPPAPSSVSTSFGYEWGYAFGNQYDDGSFWFTRDGGELWRDLPTMYEFTFRTFGYS